MITEIRYHNFRALKDATLKLSPFTLIVGPNGSGKSTAVQALPAITNPYTLPFDKVASVDAIGDPSAIVSLVATSDDGRLLEAKWTADQAEQQKFVGEWRARMLHGLRAPIQGVFFLDSAAIAAPTEVTPNSQLLPNGAHLAGVLQDLRDQHPEQFEELVNELRRWLPEYDALLFQTPQNGHKSVSLRTRFGRHAIPAVDLSQGTLFALALLTIAYLPIPPEIIAIEEPDRGIHPRLLREVRDALYRLAYPESFAITRKPVQVIATTHSPYLVDLFKDHPEEVVLSQKEGLHATLTRLTDQPNWKEIVRDAQLGDLWFSGVLGGVPVGS